jgi:hypothetical protein
MVADDVGDERALAELELDRPKRAAAVEGRATNIK